MTDPNSRLVYSTDGGRIREPVKRSAKPRSSEATSRSAPPADGVVRLHRDRKGRGGKAVTVISGVPAAPAELDALLKTLKQHCGAGGTREGSELLIQGEHRERLRSKLESLGYRVKLAGG